MVPLDRAEPAVTAPDDRRSQARTGPYPGTVRRGYCQSRVTLQSCKIAGIAIKAGQKISADPHTFRPPAGCSAVTRQGGRFAVAFFSEPAFETGGDRCCGVLALALPSPAFSGFERRRPPVMRPGTVKSALLKGRDRSSLQALTGMTTGAARRRSPLALPARGGPWVSAPFFSNPDHG